MRKVDVVRPPINYVVVNSRCSNMQIAWFIGLEDAEDFYQSMVGKELYEVAEVREVN
jgi:ATP-dependent RNA circularization protein (DNA/RNA ligase family)